MTFTPIVGSLGYVVRRGDDTVLMVRRTARPDDDHYGKLNGLGGKLEVDESVSACMRRELAEEAAIAVTSMRLRGTITWSGFGPNGEDWLGFIFLVEAWEGHPPERNDEGSLEWIPRRRLLDACSDDEGIAAAADVPMWAGDRHFVPLVFDDDQRPFHGTMPYAGDQPRSWSFERL